MASLLLLTRPAVQISDMLNAPDTRKWIGALSRALPPLIATSDHQLSEKAATLREEEADVVGPLLRSDNAVPRHRLLACGQSSLTTEEAKMVAEAVKQLPSHVQDDLLSGVVHTLGGIRAALVAVPDRDMHPMLLSASRDENGSKLSLDISVIRTNSADTPEGLRPLALLSHVQCSALKHLELCAPRLPCTQIPGQVGCHGSKQTDIGDGINAPAFSSVLALATGLTSLKLAHVNLTAATIEEIAATPALMPSLQSLSLTGSIHNTRAITAVAAILQAAPALQRLEFINFAPCQSLHATPDSEQQRIVPRLPPKPERRALCAAMHTMLRSATRLTSLSLRTDCVQLPTQIELPLLKKFQADCGLCLDAHHDDPVPLHRVLVCPAAETVSLHMHECQYSDVTHFRDFQYSDFYIEEDPPLLHGVTAPPPQDPEAGPCFPAAHTLTIGPCRKIGWCRLRQEMHYVSLHTPGESPRC